MRNGAMTSLRRLGRSTARVARTHYPAFLFGRAASDAQIPVFTYHEIGADALLDDLAFLERNGYRTIGLEEFHERSSEKAGAQAVHSAHEKLVLLTFDDARRNFWEVAFPVLRDRGARAALFVPTFWMRRTDAEPSNGFMSWEQLAECSASGLVDVEAHSHRHALVCTSERLVGFASPESLAHHDLFDWPMRHEAGVDVCGRPAAGTPIYESEPLLSAKTRLLEARSAAEACRRLVAAAGGAAPFFARANAEAELRSEHDRALQRDGGVQRMTDRELREQIEDELEQTVKCFERELNLKPRFFAYPWMLGSKHTLERLRDLGITAAFGVALDFRRVRAAREPLQVYGRYKNDWLQFLPGHGRKRLRNVLPRKLSSFLKSQHLAH